MHKENICLCSILFIFDGAVYTRGKIIFLRGFAGDTSFILYRQNQSSEMMQEFHINQIKSQFCTISVRIESNKK